MKVFVGVVVVAVCGLFGLAEADTKQCSIGAAGLAELKWPDMKEPCTKAIKGHIKAELEASMTYLVMAAQFLSAGHFRPGFAHMVLKHAGEERAHARALMDYLLMRGEAITKDEIPVLRPRETQWAKVMDALNTTLTIEIEVRDAFKKIIFECEGGADADHSDVDYHVSDFLTGVFLEEQHQGVREIAGLISILNRMSDETNGNVAFTEVEFDRTLLAH